MFLGVSIAPGATLFIVMPKDIEFFYPQNPDFSLAEAAQKSFVSEVYFRKLFKKEFNTSPKKYVIDSRIKHAVSLINSGLYTLKKIASLCGYTDYKYFSVEFKKNDGQKPV